MGEPPAAATSRTVSIMHATSWQRGVGMPVRGACIPPVLQRCAGCAGMRVLLRLSAVRQICNTCTLFCGRGSPDACILRGVIGGLGPNGLIMPFLSYEQGTRACASMLRCAE
jgi:hypothetical protein